jgi:hypothetical protein
MNLLHRKQWTRPLVSEEVKRKEKRHRSVRCWNKSEITVKYKLITKTLYERGQEQKSQLNPST